MICMFEGVIAVAGVISLIWSYLALCTMAWNWFDQGVFRFDSDTMGFVAITHLILAAILPLCLIICYGIGQWICENGGLLYLLRHLL